MVHIPECFRASASPLVIVAAVAACAPAGVGGQLPVPVIPEEPGALLSMESVNATVRPERRDFSEERMQRLRVPAGFRVDVFAQGLENPRVIRAAPNGDVFVAEREAGRVRLLRDSNGAGRADVSSIAAEGLREDPADGSLLVGDDANGVIYRISRAGAR